MQGTGNANLYQILSERFARDPGRAAIEQRNGDCFTYGDLDGETARYAALLISIGLVSGDRVAVQVEKSPQALFLYLACVRAGLVYLPMNPAYREAEIEHILDDARPAAVVCRPEDSKVMQALCVSRGIGCVLTLGVDTNGTLPEQSAAHGTRSDPAQNAPDDLAALLYTSGTTGRPKGVMLTHRNLSSNALTLYDLWGWQSHDVLLHVLPLFHTHGLFVACHCALLGASPIHFLSKFDSEAVLQALVNATVFMGVPTHYTRLLSQPDFGADACRNMRLFISGSAPLLEQTAQAFERRTGHSILERYGMTETGMNTSNPLDGRRKPGTIGLALPGVDVRVVGDGGEATAPGCVGELQVKGPNVFEGYWQQPEKTREEFSKDSYFRTGDLGFFDEDGYLVLVGRSKDLVITGGFNVYPKEVELLIDQMEGVQESAVVGLPDPDFGEAVTAAVVRSPNHTELDAEAIISTLKDTLAGYKVPKRVVFLHELPRNAMGKVQKNLIREQLQKDTPPYARASSLP